MTSACQYVLIAELIVLFIDVGFRSSTQSDISEVVIHEEEVMTTEDFSQEPAELKTHPRTICERYMLCLQ